MKLMTVDLGLECNAQWILSYELFEDD